MRETDAQRDLDIYRFTLYWTLILYVPMYCLCGFHSLLVHLLTKRSVSKIALIIPFVYVVLGLLFGVISSAIVGACAPEFREVKF